jgi:uncharacterized protein YggE
VAGVAAASLATALALTGVTPATAATAAGSEARAAATAAVDPADGVTVAGLGTVLGTPDQLRLSLRVVAVRPDASSALAAASVVAGRVRTALRQHGVAAADIATTQLSVSPVVTGKPARRTGFSVVQGLTAQLALARAGATITDVVKVGGAALRFDGVFLLLSDDSPYQAQARDRAYAQARSKAEQYARLTGRGLGPVLSVQEDVGNVYLDGSYGRFVAASSLSASGGYVVDPGTQRVDVRVQVRWSLQ